jgi:CheY-like chemotaxis protein
MTPLAQAIVEQLRDAYHCAYVTMTLQDGAQTVELGTAGSADGLPLDRFDVPVDAKRAVHVALAYPADASSASREEIRIFATSAALSIATAGGDDSDTGRILIVDDDESIRFLVRRILERSGFTVDEAANGLLAHAEAMRGQPDLVLIDWMMPVVDGLSAVKRIKADAFTAKIPIVMLTSRSQSSERLSALEAGVQDFLTKPFAPDTLLTAVRQQLRWRRLLDAGAVPSAPMPSAPTAPENPQRSLEACVALAESGEERRDFETAARAYAEAAGIASAIVNPDVANKLMRLSGKMYLLLAESTGDAGTIKTAYAAAARSFVAAGNLKLATDATGKANG